eukprot:1161295-Pelagomonas_calceolata.AAC.17
MSWGGCKATQGQGRMGWGVVRKTNVGAVWVEGSRYSPDKQIACKQKTESWKCRVGKAMLQASRKPKVESAAWVQVGPRCAANKQSHKSEVQGGPLIAVAYCASREHLPSEQLYYAAGKDDNRGLLQTSSKSRIVGVV